MVGRDSGGLEFPLLEEMHWVYAPVDSCLIADYSCLRYCHCSVVPFSLHAANVVFGKSAS